MTAPRAKAVAWGLVVVALAALMIELTVSHGSTDVFWLVFALLTLAASYAIRARSRRATVYGEQP